MANRHSPDFTYKIPDSNTQGGDEVIWSRRANRFINDHYSAISKLEGKLGLYKDNKFVLSFDNIFIANRGELVLLQMKVMRPNEEDNPIMNPTFPEKYYPGLSISHYDSFERGDVDFFKIKKIQDELTKEEFLKNFGHKFKNN